MGYNWWLNASSANGGIGNIPSQEVRPMRNWTRPLTMLALVCALVVYGLRATGEQAPPDLKIVKLPADAKPPTHKVEKGPFKIEVTLKGVFEAEQMTEIALRPEAWNPQSGGGMLVLRKAVEHGTAVKKGDPILWLETEKLAQTIRDMENDRQLAELAIRQAEEELPLLEKSAPHDLAVAERAKRITDEDLKRYTETERALMVKSADQMLKTYRNYLEYAKEELKQLEKMYRSKDLTEETEEIILRRQRNEVESITFMVKMAEHRHENLMKIDLPRRDQSMQEEAVKAAINWDKARTSIPTQVNQKKLALAKLKYERQKAEERLAKLKRDLEAMTVRAPNDGIVYHGKCVRGQWQSGGLGGDRLRPGAPVQPEEVLLTVVRPNPFFVRAEVEEKDLQYLQGTVKGKASPAIAPDVRLPAKLAKLSLVPVSAGKFDARFTIEAGADGPTLMPGMACTVKVTPYVKEQALSVPSAAVFTDELDEDKHYVYLADKDGKPAKQPVTVGKKAGTRTEILEGLKEGDEILTEKPGAKKADTPSKEVKP